MIISNKYEKNLCIPINLSFFEGEKTEQPTSKKKQKAREEGQVALSQEVGTAIVFIAGFYVLKFSGKYVYERCLEYMYFDFNLIRDINTIFEIEYMRKMITAAFLRVFIVCMPIFAVTCFVGIVSNVMQVGWHPTIKPLMPKLSAFSPVKGFQRIFSMRSLMEFVKSLMKMAVVCLAVYSCLKGELNQIQTLMVMEVMPAMIYIGSLCMDVGIRVGYYFIFIALLDFAFQRYTHNKKLKMSKQEVKDEYKQVEGDPHVKGKIKQKMREASMRRMMQEVPNADVIITNPTHYAVAIKYDRTKNAAPMVIAKGVDHLARRIKEIAKDNAVEIVENKPLARALYNTVDVGREIPQELYQAVAEVLAFVYKLKNAEV